jgi:hypothetical protein
MRFMILLKADKNTEAGVPPSTELIAAMMKYNEELTKAGVFLAGEGLQPSSKGICVRFSAGKRTVTDGPFDRLSDVMDRGSAGLGDRGVQQIGANCRRRVEAEEQNKQRRHQRSAADAGQAYNEAHAESGHGIGEHDNFNRAHGGYGMNSRAFTAGSRCR